VGASGDLTRRKLLPAVFALYCNDMLPHNFTIFGFARSKMSDAEFRDMAARTLTCRYGEDDNGGCEDKMTAFLDRCFYQAGQYDSPDGFQALQERIREVSTEAANTLSYMAIPPSIFLDTARSIGAVGLVARRDDGFWSRVVLEKPFGRDSESSRELIAALGEIYAEDQSYRIDHYLGKEVIQNLLVLRFANLIFEPIWNRSHIDHVSISWGETIGCEGRAGYFDSYGIIRDVLQNHLLQILALVAMEQPIALDAEHIRDEKVKVLRCVPPVDLENLVTGQYRAANVHGVLRPGYLDDDEVPSDSLTETYARATLKVNNPRWYGVPFYLEAGKALATSRTEICVQFKDVPYSIFGGAGDANGANRLVIRVQPNEAIELHVTNKVPGHDFELESADLNLLYKSTFSAELPDAYERLLLDVMRGDRSLFIRDDELAVAWDIVTPAMRELEEKQIIPKPYPYGSTGPT
jgi:glucose-6-phosphate 1-dehydrogenase